MLLVSARSTNTRFGTTTGCLDETQCGSNPAAMSRDIM